MNYQPRKIYVLKSKEALGKIRSITKSTYNAPLVLLICPDTDRAWHSSFTKGYKTFEKQVYTRIYQTAEPTFNPNTDCVGDFCYWDMPSIDSALLTQARKLLKNARLGAEQISVTQ